MKKERTLLTALVAILSLILFLGFIYAVKNAIDQGNNEAALEQEAERIELAKQDIVAEYGFDPVIWLKIEKVNNIEGRDDFYIITCLVDEGELHLYQFAAVVKDINGEIDVDTWRIKEAT